MLNSLLKTFKKIIKKLLTADLGNAKKVIQKFQCICISITNDNSMHYNQAIYKN